jgi:hypothetical protein
MTALIITDIKESSSCSGQHLITGIISGAPNRSVSDIKRSCDSLLVLESATAEVDLPMIGVGKGVQFVRMWAPPGHGLKVGEEMLFEDGT